MQKYLLTLEGVLVCFILISFIAIPAFVYAESPSRKNPNQKTIDIIQLNPKPSVTVYGENKKSSFNVVQQDFKAVVDLSVGQNGKYFVTVGGYDDKTLKIWTVDGIVLNTINLKFPANCVKISPDGRIIATGHSNNDVNLWTFEGRLLKNFDGPSYHSVYSVDFSPNGKTIAVGSLDKTVRLWSVEKGVLLRTLSHSESNLGAVKSVAFSPNGSLLVSGSWDETLKIWRTKDGKLLNTLKDHSDRVTSVTFSPNGETIASGSQDGTVKLWSTKNGKLLNTIQSHAGWVNCVAFSSNGKIIASGGDYKDKSVKLWNTDGNLVRTLKLELTIGGSINNLAFTPDDKMIISALPYDQRINITNLDRKLENNFKASSGNIQNIAISPDGTFIAASIPEFGISLWSHSGKLIKTIRNKSHFLRGLAFTPNGNAIAYAVGRQVNLHSIEHNTLIRTFRARGSDSVNCVAFSPDGKFLAAGSDEDSPSYEGDKPDYNTIKIWHVDSGKLYKTFKYTRYSKSHSGYYHNIDVDSIAFSPDGATIASGSEDKTVKIWRIKDSKLLKTYKGSGSNIKSVAFSPNGKTIASGPGELWSLESDKLIKKFRHGFYFNSIAFSPDGNTIATGTDDQTVKLWNINGDLIKTFSGHTDDVNSVVFSPDGKTIISGSKDRSIKIWNVQTGEHISLLGSGEEWLAYTADGYFDASKNGGDMVSMVKNLTAYRVDQFALRNNRPDILLKRIGFGDRELINHYYAQFKRRLKKSGLSENELSSDLHLPTAMIVNTKQHEKFVDVTFNLKDSKYSLNKYNIYVNDVPIYGAYGKEIKGNNLSKTEKIELTNGKNKIEVTAINDIGAESYRAITFKDYNKDTKGDLYYIGFGVSKYKDTKLNLGYADKDAFDLAELLKKMVGKYNNIYTKTYLNNKVTLENIKNAKYFLKNAKVDDTFIFFIAGHGVHDMDNEGTYYYLTHNTDLSSLSETAANFDAIEDLLQGIAPRYKLFLMDTCESGEIDEDIKKQYFAMADSRGIKARTARGIKIYKTKGKQKKVNRTWLYEKDRFIYNDLFRRSGAIVFSSSRGGEFSYESNKLKNGFFTYEIIKALTTKKADKNNDRKITISELRNYVAKTVALQTDNQQNPTIDRDNIYQKLSLPICSE